MQSDEKESGSSLQEHLERAREKYAAAEYQEALRSLGYGFTADMHCLPLYEIAVACLQKLDAPEEAALFHAVLNTPDDPQVYKNLGNHFMEEKHYVLALAFYEGYHALAPEDQEILHDLAICYARRFRMKDALATMESLESNDFWDIYFRNKCRILSGETAEVPEDIEAMSNLLENYPDQDEVYWPKVKTRELHDMLQRLRSVPEPAMHIRDWHFIHYGSVILDYFESDEYVAGGRYVALWGSFNAVKGVALRLRKFAEELAVPIDHVAALDDRDSEITGRVLARELGLEFTTYHPEGAHKNALIVAGDASELGRYEALNTARDGQILFALNLDWLDTAYICPDICGYMSQYYYFPWNDGCYRMNQETQKMERIPPDMRSPQEIADDICNEVPGEEHAAANYDFYAQHRDQLKGIGSLGDPFRHSFVIESPVPGSHFE